ncbi:MAG: LUD domain-containing protein [Rhodospirillaceae bacterium]|nr:LUD domain-containing protein [Rhodospirillaceae bacterium]
MSSARNQIFANLAAGYAGRNDAAAKVGVESRLAKREPNIVPARAQVENRKAALAQFTAMATEAAATVAVAHTMIDLPGVVTDYLRSHNLPMRAVAAPDPLLDAARWERRKTLDIRRGRAEAFDEVGISVAWRGVVETGTLVMTSGEATPTTINFLPETEIVILPIDRLVGSYEEALAPLRGDGTRDGKHGLPRVVNFITGPSRSADIEQTLQLGAHGPRRLHIIVVDDQTAPAKA